MLKAALINGTIWTIVLFIIFFIKHKLLLYFVLIFLVSFYDLLKINLNENINKVKLKILK